MFYKLLGTVEQWRRSHPTITWAALSLLTQQGQRQTKPSLGQKILGRLTGRQEAQNLQMDEQQRAEQSAAYESRIREAIRNSESEPVPLPLSNGDVSRFQWIFKEEVYDVSDIRWHHSYDDEQIQLLILEYFDKERRKFEKLMRLYKSDPVQEGARRRERIPEQVRIEVWRRDGGKCARCGSREKLEYDHIVPVSKGGGNTARNIELLCEKCNREKGNRVE